MFSLSKLMRHPCFLNKTINTETISNNPDIFNLSYILENFPYLSQTDNKWFSSTSCYPTSMAMALLWCIQKAGLSLQEIGWVEDLQVEDWITQITESKETKQWIKNNIGKYGVWMLDYKPRTIAVVEEYIFNSIMNKHGFKCTFSANLTYMEYCDYIKNTNMPIVLHGSFKSVSKVAGHIVCGVGFNTDRYKLTERNKIIVHDPYGNAVYDKYKSHTMGAYAEYPIDFFIKDNGKLWGQVIEEV